MTKMQKPKLYRIWLFNSNDRREIARIKAFEFETVQQFLLEIFIKPETKEEIELYEHGLMWNENTPEQCLENIDKSCDNCYWSNALGECEHDRTKLDDYCDKWKLDEDYNPCEYCDGCTAGFQIEEIEDPDGVSWGETFEFKTIYGTNDYYDLTTEKALIILKRIGEIEKHITNNFIKQNLIAPLWKELDKVSKAPDPDKELKKAWEKSPEIGIAQLILSTIRDKPELTPVFSKELIEESKRKVKEGKQKP